MADSRQDKGTLIQAARRNVLKGAVGAALAAGLAPQTIAAASTSVGGESAPLGAPAQLTVGTSYGLQLQNSSFGAIPAAAGGDSYAEVLTKPTTAGALKAIGPLKYETIALTAGPSAPRPFFTAINKVLTNTQTAQSGAIASIAVVGGVPKTVGILQMTNAYVSQLSFPTLGGGNTDPFKVIYTATSTAEAPLVSVTPVTKAPLAWSPANFQLTINGTVIAVQQVNAWQVKIPVDRDIDWMLRLGPAEYGDLVFRIADTAKSSSTLRDWYKNTALVGKTINYNAVLTILDAAGYKQVIQLDLSQIGIYRLRSVDVGILEATCYVNEARVTYPSGQLGPI